MLWVFFGVFFSGEGGGLGGSDMIKGSNFFKKNWNGKRSFLLFMFKEGGVYFP